jgi:lysozyme
MLLHTNKAGIDLIKSFENLVLKPYLLPGEHFWTAGWGHSGPDVIPSKTYTLTQALAWLLADVAAAENVVTHHVTYPLNQNQFSALVSFVFNVGGGKFTGSTLLRKVNAGDLAGVPLQLGRWIYGSSNRVMPGLIKRRRAEAALWNTPVTVGPDQPVA